MTESLAEQFVDLLFLNIRAILTSGDSLMIKDFGVFESRQTKPRTLCGKFSKEPKAIPAHLRPKFKASKTLVNDMN
jgi:nucleoid DNA-binding protein